MSTPSAPLPVGPGDVVAGKYRVERELGEGGMGVVVVATHLLLEHRVAIKFVRGEATPGGPYEQRFLREAKNALALRSEHVARVLDFGRLESGASFIVMELLEGDDLGAVLVKTGPMAIEAAVECIVQACEALAEAHALGIVHRDLKPTNLFLSRRSDGSPLVKVLDFGLSKARPVLGERALTLSASMMGTPYYMPPEQLDDVKHVDERADIWALGVTLFELLTGCRPFEGSTAPAVIAAVAAKPPASLRGLRPDVPRPLESVVLRCLEKQPEARPQSVGELVEALRFFTPMRAIPLIDRITATLEGSATTEVSGTVKRPATPPAHVAAASGLAEAPTQPAPDNTLAPTTSSSSSAKSRLAVAAVVGACAAGAVWTALHFDGAANRMDVEAAAPSARASGALGSVPTLPSAQAPSALATTATTAEDASDSRGPAAPPTASAAPSAATSASTSAKAAPKPSTSAASRKPPGYVKRNW